MPKNKDKSYSHALKYLARRISPHKKWYIFASILSLVSVGVNLLNVKVTGRLVDNAVLGSMGEIAQSAIFLTIIIAVNFVTARFSGVCVARFSYGAVRDMKSGIADVLVRADYREIVKLRAGDVLSTVNADAQIVSEFLSGNLISLFSQALMALGAIVYLLCTDPVLMLVTFAYTPIGMFFTLTLNAKMNKLYPVRADRAGDSLSVIEQALAQIPVIKSFVLEAQMKRRIQEHNNTVLDADMSVARPEAMLQTACQSTSSIPHILFFLYAGALVMHGDMTLGAFIAIFDLLNFIIGPSVYFPFLMNGLNRAVASANRAKDIEKLPREVKRKIMRGSPSIEMENVEFSYTQGSPILKSISFSFQKPGIVALKGKSGRGKTTLLDLITGLMQPDSGELFVNGAVAVLEQEPFLFEWDTERENANATLSGGQKQKTAFARMERADAEVWLLDEPTASLDAESVRELLAILEQERSRRLIVISSHNQAIWEMADAVLDLDAKGGAAL